MILMNLVKTFLLTLSISLSSSLLLSQNEEMQTYYFGHSLVAHTMGDQSIPHWMYLLSQNANRDYAVDGQFGFLPMHEIPPIASWGFEIVPSAWQGNFATSNYDNVVITAANFIQYQAPTEEFLGTNTLDASLVIYDYVDGQSPGIKFYIYENWPEFNNFPPSANEFDQYHAYTRGAFHDWWIDLQDLCNAERPNAQIKLIPVGYILSGLMTDFPDLEAVTATDWYEDGDPHGEAVIYFLTALIHYSALYQEQPPLDFAIPTAFPDAISNLYPEIIDYIWSELEAFNDEEGNSRVFFGTISSNTEIIPTTFKVFPNPFTDILNISPQDFQANDQLRVYNMLGKLIHQEEMNLNIDTSDWTDGVYCLAWIRDGQVVTCQKVIKSTD